MDRLRLHQLQYYSQTSIYRAFYQGLLFSSKYRVYVETCVKWYEV